MFRNGFYWLAAMVFAFSAFSRAELAEKDLTTSAISGREADWHKVLALGGAVLPPAESVSSLLGPLPGSTELARAGAMEPEAFLSLYEASSAEVREVMEISVRARLREIGRRDVLAGRKVDALLGPEGAGVSGSMFFGVPAIPEEAYKALVDYTVWSARLAADGAYNPSPLDLARLDRSLQTLLSLSTPGGRLEYRDFDVVHAEIRRHYIKADDAGKRELLPGALWLYIRLREAARIEDFPPVPDPLFKSAAAEGGALFLSAREEAGAMPASISALTVW